MAASSNKKLLTIFGATGNQGGSILDIVLARPDLKEKYALRGITRDPSSKKSQALNEQGVEMVKADVDDAESVKAATKDSYGVFGVTDFWSILDKEREIRQGKNIFHACKENGVKHFVWSALPYSEKITEGKLKHVDHFDSKAIVAEFVEENKGDMIASHCMPGKSAFSHLQELPDIL
jgi:putative NADH-flavin reductase